MKLEAKSRLRGAEDPISTGVIFDTLVDGDPRQEEPEVQEDTHDDGGIETPPEQALLVDDISGG